MHATGQASKDKALAGEKAKEVDKGDGGDGQELVVEDAKLPPDPVVAADNDQAARVAARSSWFGWWSRPDGYASDGETREVKKQKLDAAEDEQAASSTPLPGTTPTDEGTSFGVRNALDFEGVGGGKGQMRSEDVPHESAVDQRGSKSWFGLWSMAQNQKATTDEQSSTTPSKAAPVVTVTTEPSNVEDTMKDDDPPSVTATVPNTDPPKSSAWAFWSGDKAKDAAPTPGGMQKQVGELAVAGTPSQSNPEAAQFNEQREQREQQKAKPEVSGSLLKPKRGRADEVKTASAQSSPTPSAEQSPAPSTKSLVSSTPTTADVTQPSKRAKTSTRRPNWTLPSFRETFAPATNPGYMDRLTNYLAQTLHLPSGQTTTAPQHVFISTTPPRIKSAVAIGIHGFFPGALLQKVLGQPTGTSIRFANHAAAAIKTWCEAHQPDIHDVEIETVALEGEGYIADRVNTLWKLLLNWLSQLRSADFILVACHSQGVPVAVMLVAKLIHLGCLAPHVRVGICAMAGISLGPFLEYKSRFFGGSALELFEFSDSSSAVSKSYAASLDTCLRHGVRLTLVGSLDDQLVSLESSLHAPLTHPYVARAVFVDGRIHAPNFLTHLVVLALKLRNLGLSDHGLLRELSGPLAGSLVGGDGHSRIYDEADVYQLAVEFAMESTDVVASSSSSSVESESTKSLERTRSSRGEEALAALAGSARRASGALSTSSSVGIAPRIAAYEPPPAGATPNPFYLPWAVRGMLEEEVVKTDAKLREEVEVLVREFEEWRPSSKVLRDVRWRLEGVRKMH